MDLIEVAAGLIVRDGRILVCQRAFDGAHPGKFEFPGGKREAGETLEQCLERELAEELSVEVRVGELLSRTRHQYGEQRPVELSFFAIAELGGDMVNRVFASTRWVSLEELGSLDFLEGDLEVVGQLCRCDLTLPDTAFSSRAEHA